MKEMAFRGRLLNDMPREQLLPLTKFLFAHYVNNCLDCQLGSPEYSEKDIDDLFENLKYV